MKKNRMMRVASALLVAVLLTTCCISGTFAKYTSSASGNDEARVAKWGFNTTTLTIDLFDGSYDNVAAGVNVVAPGTTKTTTITLIPDTQTEAPEVAYSFDANISYTGSDSLMNKLVWYLNDTKCGENGTFAELQAAIDTLLDKTEIEAGNLPASTITVKWEWPFYIDDVEDASDKTLAVNGDSMTITFAFTATQVD